MKRLLTWSATLLLLCISWEALSRFCGAQTDRFTLLKIQAERIDSPLAQAPLTHSCSQETLSTLLSQPFHYLARGGQAFAFVSADGQYVLKLSKRRFTSLYHTLATLPLPHYLHAIFQKKWQNAVSKRERDLKSYLIAYTEVPDLTGLIYMHLDRQPSFHEQVTIIDKIGIAHTIDLNDTTFLIQKRAEPISHYLARIEGDEKQMRYALCALLDTIQAALERGIVDDDPGLHRNFGFAGSTPLFIDVGRLQTANRPLTAIAGRFRAFLETEHPLLLPFFDSELAQRTAHENH